MIRITRRKLLAGSAATLALSAQLDRLWAKAEVNPELASHRIHPSKRGTRSAILPFEGEPEVRFGVTEGRGLQGRRLLDLSSVGDPELETPADRYFIRTRTPEYLPAPESWRLSVRTLTGAPLDLPKRELEPMAKPQGPHLCECAENGAEARFGLMSAAEWRGVPLLDLLDRHGMPEGDWLLLVEGFDRFTGTAVEPNAGASWIFTPRDLAATGAFLATEMNDAPLAPDHGAPLRLVVPGWYGCTWIKWVHSVVVVPGDTLCSTHMREWARPTRQPRRPRLARDYRPPVIDPVALPVRFERWRWRGYFYYRINGIVWGGSEPAESITIRLDPATLFEPVDWFPPPGSATQWSLWSHDWCPSVPGVYTIELAVGGSRLRTRRLAAGDYTRAVRVDEV